MASGVQEGAGGGNLARCSYPSGAGGCFFIKRPRSRRSCQGRQSRETTMECEG